MQNRRLTKLSFQTDHETTPQLIYLRGERKLRNHYGVVAFGWAQTGARCRSHRKQCNPFKTPSQPSYLLEGAMAGFPCGCNILGMSTWMKK